MSAELDGLLARASNEIEAAAPSLDGGRLGVVRAAARRRRIARHAAESFAGVGAVGVLGVGLWFGLGQATPDEVVPVETPTVTPSPSDTPTPTPTPSSTPTSTPTGPPTRAESIDDAVVIERLAAPRTGEQWHSPERTPEMDAVLEQSEWSTSVTYRVGTRADSVIYISVGDGNAPWANQEVSALFEVDAAGPRLIACPSARTGDPCAGSAAEPTVVRDEETFYDSLTMPQSIDLDGYVVTTTHARASEFASVYGDAQALSEQPSSTRTLRQLGALAVVERTAPAEIADLTNIEFGVMTPFGSFFALTQEDLPAGEFEAIQWDDGIRRVASDGPDGDDYTAFTRGPGAPSCVSWHFSRASSHVPAQWRAAGTTPGGHRVYVPAAGGSSLSQAVRAWHEENSWTVSELGSEDPAADEYGTLHGAAAGYTYPTDQAFLEANALFAVQGPAGEWMLGMRSDASNVVYECA
ncbi:hypothetical protein [Cellulomonas xylanilytica]|uniref:Uncharacterized protein n=1 Tax=Cellulomonas xylanilytica TaxID=233583 RepID=A0A510V7Q8_9CELL|nr:hypothetical protein [Cellulomonas xylanilytica]GEK22816.1 hypothetical protein CXY01_33360 [Cellulomonas xylanilytica]